MSWAPTFTPGGGRWGRGGGPPLLWVPGQTQDPSGSPPACRQPDQPPSLRGGPIPRVPMACPPAGHVIGVPAETFQQAAAGLPPSALGPKTQESSPGGVGGPFAASEKASMCRHQCRGWGALGPGLGGMGDIRAWGSSLLCPQSPVTPKALPGTPSLLSVAGPVLTRLPLCVRSAGSALGPLRTESPSLPSRPRRPHGQASRKAGRRLRA